MTNIGSHDFERRVEEFLQKVKGSDDTNPTAAPF